MSLPAFEQPHNGLGPTQCLREPALTSVLPTSGFRIYGYDTADGPTLYALCGCGWMSALRELGPADDASLAADDLLKAGCDRCGVTEDARLRWRAIDALVIAGSLKSLRVIR